MINAIALTKKVDRERRESQRHQEQQLAAHLKKHGLKITQRSRQPRDGNCWASAISFGLAHELGRQVSPEEVRRQAAATLISHREFFQPFFAATSSSIDAGLYLAECQKMTRRGMWKSELSNIGDLLVFAFSFHSQVSIRCFCSDGSIALVDFEPSSGSPQQWINVARTVLDGDEHYDGVEKQSTRERAKVNRIREVNMRIL